MNRLFVALLLAVLLTSSAFAVVETSDIRAFINSSSASGTLHVVNVSNAQHFFINGTSGNVGIGIIPTALLQLEGANFNLKMRGNLASGTYAYFTQSSTGTYLSHNAFATGANQFTSDASTGASQILADRGFISFRVNSSVAASPTAIVWTEKIRMNDSSVGIDTATPFASLTVKGAGTGYVNIGQLSDSNNYGAMNFVRTSLSSTNYNIASLGTDLLVNTVTGGSIYFRENNNAAARVTILTGGTVGINTTTPTHLLNVVGGANITQNILTASLNATTGNITVNGYQGIVYANYSKTYQFLNATGCLNTFVNGTLVQGLCP